MGVGLGALLRVTLISPVLPVHARRNRELWSSRVSFYWQLVISIVFPDCNGADAAN